MMVVPPRHLKEMPRGVRCDRPVELLDVYRPLVQATALEAKPSDEQLDGLNLLPWIADPYASKERPAITTIYAHNHSVVDTRYRYTRYAEGSEEFYDRQTDPHEFSHSSALQTQRRPLRIQGPCRLASRSHRHPHGPS